MDTHECVSHFSATCAAVRRYAIVCMLITTVVVIPVVRATFRVNQSRGFFRFTHARIKEYAEAIVFYDGQDRERTKATNEFEVLYVKALRLCTRACVCVCTRSRGAGSGWETKLYACAQCANITCVCVCVCVWNSYWRWRSLYKRQAFVNFWNSFQVTFGAVFGVFTLAMQFHSVVNTTVEEKTKCVWCCSRDHSTVCGDVWVDAMACVGVTSTAGFSKKSRR